jgi:type II secretory ATPase GspE/PulE/Tfp pilus assembly ATPase PilB-like protein
MTRVFNLGAKPYMLAGTFNLVMAQRLVRTICPNCKTKVSLKDDPKYLYARKTFNNFEKEALKKEIISRGITQTQRDGFINDGIVSI